MGLWDELECAVAPPNPLNRTVQTVAAVRPVSAVLRRVQHPLDRALGSLSGGRLSVTQPLSGLPTITLVTVGARTGQRRHTPLVAIPLEGDIAVIGSGHGGEHTPGWVHNLGAHPDVEVEHRGRTVAATARRLDRESAETVWATAASTYAGYAHYRRRAAHREITVWRLSPRDG
jgi:deazaflavin-dependent oxidoreductase (nitroreductase family)